MTISVAVTNELLVFVLLLDTTMLAVWLDPVVLNNTPPTMPTNPRTSSNPRLSMPHNTANMALDIGSAAFRVST